MSRAVTHANATLWSDASTGIGRIPAVSAAFPRNITPRPLARAIGVAYTPADGVAVKLPPFRLSYRLASESAVGALRATLQAHITAAESGTLDLGNYDAIPNTVFETFQFVSQVPVLAAGSIHWDVTIEFHFAWLKP